MATAGTEDSDLLFQFNSPINNNLPIFFNETKENLSSEVSSSGNGSNGAGNTGGNRASHRNENISRDNGSVRSHVTSNLRRMNQQQFHSGMESTLDDAKILSQYNNYLNDKFSHKRKLSQDSELIKLRQKKLEELVDKFWLKDGEIDEAMFDSSSDEE